MNRLYTAYGLMIAAGMLACTTATSDPDAVSSGDAVTQPPPDDTASQVLGLVLDEGGEPLSGVTVSSNGRTATTSSQGTFTLDVPGNSRSVLIFRRDGVADVFRTVEPRGAPSVTVSAVMAAPQFTGTVPADTGDTVTVEADDPVAPGGTIEVILVFEGDSFVRADGTPVSGNVDVQVTFVGREQGEDAPIPLVAFDGPEAFPLVTYGMIDVTASQGGERLDLASGKGVVVRYPSRAGDPDSAGFFSGDEAQGLWVLEDAAANVNGQWTAVMTHLSWWNIDGFLKVPPNEQTCVRLRTVDTSGAPLRGVELKIRWDDNGVGVGGSTDGAGFLCERRFPAGETLTVKYRGRIGGASAQITGETAVAVPGSGLGLTCDDPACPTVTVVLSCSADSQCPPGVTCQDGLCGEPGDPPVGGPCVPQCSPGQCSDDGCGKPCLECPSGQICGVNATCVDCTPDCTNKICGTDGCSGSCGVCGAGTSCQDGFQCVTPCTFCPTGNCTSYDFESGLTGWDVTGDATTIPALGSTPAPQGQQMLRLSTGLAFAAPSFAQKALCVSQPVSTVTFRWRLYSEEFEEFCGSDFQDTFSVAFDSGGGPQELFLRTIDNLCPTTACSGCGDEFVGLTASDIQFDQGGVFATPWQQTTLNLPGGVQSGTLIFRVEDVGDSSFDTVVLLDDIRLQ